MHIAHLIAVEAESVDDAIMDADHALNPYGVGQVWDWYCVGGRWGGTLEGGNVLRYSDNPEAFKKSVEDMLRFRNETFMELQAKLTGRTISPEDVRDYVLGFPVKDREGAAERMTASNQDTRRAFGRLLEASSLKDAQSMDLLASYYLSQFSRLVMGTYMFDSRFYDGVSCTTSDEDLWDRCEEEPEMQWLVLVDLHN